MSWGRGTRRAGNTSHQQQVSSPCLLVANSQGQRPQTLTKGPSTPQAGHDLTPVTRVTETRAQEPASHGNEHPLRLPTEPTSAGALRSSSSELPCTRQPSLSGCPCSSHFQAPKFPNNLSSNLSNHGTENEALIHQPWLTLLCAPCEYGSHGNTWPTRGGNGSMKGDVFSKLMSASPERCQKRGRRGLLSRMKGRGMASSPCHTRTWWLSGHRSTSLSIG